MFKSVPAVMFCVTLSACANKPHPSFSQLDFQSMSCNEITEAFEQQKAILRLTDDRYNAAMEEYRAAAYVARPIASYKGCVVNF